MQYFEMVLVLTLHSCTLFLRFCVYLCVGGEVFDVWCVCVCVCVSECVHACLCTLLRIIDSEPKEEGTLFLPLILFPEQWLVVCCYDSQYYKWKLTHQPFFIFSSPQKQTFENGESMPALYSHAVSHSAVC